MKRIIICLSVFSLVPAFASAQVRYDLKLEEAVKTNIANKIGDIRPGFKYGQTPRIEGMTSDSSSPFAAAPRPVSKSWQVVGGDASMTDTISGSFQTFSDGKIVTPQQRHLWATKTVSRVINF